MDVTYCKYGTLYRKQTRLWTNMRCLCRPGSRCEAWQDGRHLRAAQQGPRLMEGQYERVSQSRELLYSVPAALCEKIARAATEELAERLSIPDRLPPRGLENANFSMFLHVFWAVPLNAKNGEEGHPPPFFSFFWAHSKAVVHQTPKMVKRDTGPFFCRFCSTLKAVSRCVKNEAEGHRASFLVFVSLNTKNGEERHRALVKHGNARAGESRQLVGHQMNRSVIVPSRPLKVNRARSPERVLTPLSGILGTRSVGKPAMRLWRR